MSVSAKMREGTASATREHKFLSENFGNMCVEELDEKARLQSEKRQK